MKNLVCIRHADYDGQGAPELSCKTCCKMYVDAIRASQTVQIDSKTTRIKNALEKMSKNGTQQG